MDHTFIPGIAPPAEQVQPCWWFAFVGHKLLVRSEGGLSQIPSLNKLEDLGLIAVRTQFLGTLDQQACYSAELPRETVAPEGMAFQGLRDLYNSLEEQFFILGGRAFQVMEWDRTHQHCGHCATLMTQLPSERAKRCPTCGLVNYPRISPAVIMLISRGKELLLARAHRFPESFYSVLAGFVEPGESLEETVIREVREEVGVEVKDVRYFGSQSWPFPNSLMIGFTAVYDSGDIVIEQKELADAAWFSKDNLPQIPPKLSIARKLIDWFIVNS
jgi:NAD+ diphosphatase